jgi:hypothetical protein
MAGARSRRLRRGRTPATSATRAGISRGAISSAGTAATDSWFPASRPSARCADQPTGTLGPPHRGSALERSRPERRGRALPGRARGVVRTGTEPHANGAASMRRSMCCSLSRESRGGRAYARTRRTPFMPSSAAA